MIILNPAVQTEVLRSRFENAVQQMMDTAAIARGYDSLATAISYAEEPAVSRFQKDGQAFREWRSRIWDYVYNALEGVDFKSLESVSLQKFLSGAPGLNLSNAD